MNSPRGTAPRRGDMVVATLGAVTLLLAACNGNSARPGVASLSASSPSGSSSAGQSVLYFSHCMRSHGVPRFPDPVDAAGDLPKQFPASLQVSSTQFNAAAQACLNLLPPIDVGDLSASSHAFERCQVGGICLPAVTHWLQNTELKFSHCMRNHGLSTWPDPTTDAQGRVDFPVPLAWAQQLPEPQGRLCRHLTHTPVW